MSYVHCHNCLWKQDDFWSWNGYNPLQFFLKNELSYIRPRYIKTDATLVNHTPFTLRFGLTRKVMVPYELNTKEVIIHSVDPCDETCMCHKHTVIEHQTHSWLLLWRCIAKWGHRIRNQVWWTLDELIIAIHDNNDRWPCCPMCGANDLDID